MDRSYGGDSSSMYSLGILFLSGTDGAQTNDTQAMSWFSQAAAYGDSRAMQILGSICEQGKLIPQNTADAIKWYKWSARLGNIEAMCKLAVIYLDGRGVMKDGTEAVKWYKIAAAAGNAHAMMQLAMMYEAGHGVPQNKSLSKEWLDSATLQQRAQHASFDAPHDDTEELVLLRRAAETGDSDAMYRLANFEERFNGRYLVNSIDRSRYEYRAAQMGHLKAMKSIAGDYETGRREAFARLTEAARWLWKAAILGDVGAMDDLSNAYTYGEGVPKDIYEANRWTQAARVGNANSITSLKTFPADLVGNLERRYNQLMESASHGDSVAMYSLGLMFQETQSPCLSQLRIAHDDYENDERKHWYRLAADSGNIEAMLALGDYKRAADNGCTWAIFALIESGTPELNRVSSWWESKYDTMREELIARLLSGTENKPTIYLALGDIAIRSKNSYFCNYGLRPAAKYYQLAATGGSVEAMYRLGLIGKIIDESIESNFLCRPPYYSYFDLCWRGAILNNPDSFCVDQVKWFRQAADLGDTRAMIEMGHFYSDGIKGDQYSFSQTGERYKPHFYENGQFVDVSKSEAINWYRRAAALGSAEARNMLAKLGAEPSPEREIQQNNSSSYSEANINTLTSNPGVYLNKKISIHGEITEPDAGSGDQSWPPSVRLILPGYKLITIRFGQSVVNSNDILNAASGFSYMVKIFGTLMVEIAGGRPYILADRIDPE